jgi:anti-sigma factor RsiW
MISCREFADFIGAYFDGELPENQLGEFQQHMSACPWCVAYLSSYKDTVALGRAAFADGDGPPQDVPEELVKAVLAALRKS